MFDNRLALLSALRKQFGYDGPDDLSAVKSWLKENESVVKLDFKSGDLDKLWTKAVTLNVMGGALTVEEEQAAAADMPEEEEEPQEMRARSADPDAARWKQAADGAASKTGRVHKAMVHTEGKGGRFTAAVRLYDQRIKAYGVGTAKHQAKFHSAEVALAAGAYYRFKTLEPVHARGLVNYTHREDDLAVLSDFFGKDGNSVINYLGGATVAPEFVADLLYMTEQYGVARRLCNVIQMGPQTMYPRKTAIGGATWEGEGDTQTATDDEFDDVELIPRKLGRLIKYSSELAEDTAINLANSYNESIAESFANKEDEAFVNGDGTSTYGGHVGLKNALPANAYIQGSGNAWTALTESDILKLPGTAENVNLQRSTFVCSRQFYFQVMVRLAEAKGGNTISDTFSGPGISKGADANFLGWPVMFSQVAPTASASGTTCLYFGDFVGAAMFGDRRAPRIVTSTDRYIEEDKIAIRATERVSINIHGDGRGSTYGPIVALKTS